MGLIDCLGASYSLPWKLAIMSSESFSPSMGFTTEVKSGEWQPPCGLSQGLAGYPK